MECSCSGMPTQHVWRAVDRCIKLRERNRCSNEGSVGTGRLDRVWGPKKVVWRAWWHTISKISHRMYAHARRGSVPMPASITIMKDSQIQRPLCKVVMLICGCPDPLPCLCKVGVALCNHGSAVAARHRGSNTKQAASRRKGSLASRAHVGTMRGSTMH